MLPLEPCDQATKLFLHLLLSRDADQVCGKKLYQEYLSYCILRFNVLVYNFSVMSEQSHQPALWGVNVPCSRTQYGAAIGRANLGPLDLESDALTRCHRAPQSSFYNKVHVCVKLG